MLMFAAMLVQLAMLITMLMWQPNKGTIVVFFVVAGLWGAADGVFVTQVISKLFCLSLFCYIIISCSTGSFYGV